MKPMSLPDLQAPMHALVEWFRRHRAADELAGLGEAEAQNIARDLNVSFNDLVNLAQQSGDESELMTRMMTLHGLDRGAIEADLPALVRQMAVTCSYCQCKGECAHDLDAGVGVEKTDSYCPNADSMHALSGR